MIPAAFDYVAPATLAEALDVLSERGDGAKILAGGQSLLPILRMRLNAPDVLVDLGKVTELQGVFDDGPGIVIGAMTTYHDLLADPLVREHAALLIDAVETVADPQIRHRGTIGGAIAHADPGRRRRSSGARARRVVRHRRAARSAGRRGCRLLRGQLHDGRRRRRDPRCDAA